MNALTTDLIRHAPGTELRRSFANFHASLKAAVNQISEGLEVDGWGPLLELGEINTREKRADETWRPGKSRRYKRCTVYTV